MTIAFLALLAALLLLGGGLAFGLFRTRTTDPGLDAAGEAATRRLYGKGRDQPTVRQRNAATPPGPGKGAPRMLVVSMLSLGVILMAGIVVTAVWYFATIKPTGAAAAGVEHIAGRSPT